MSNPYLFFANGHHIARAVNTATRSSDVVITKLDTGKYKVAAPSKPVTVPKHCCPLCKKDIGMGQCIKKVTKLYVQNVAIFSLKFVHNEY